MFNPSRLNVIPQSQYEAEFENPSSAPSPVGPRPPPLFRRPNVSIIPDDDPDLLSSAGVRKPNCDKSGWISRRTREEVEEYQDVQYSFKQLQKQVAKKAHYADNISKLKVGAHIWTKDPQIANLTRKKGPKGKRRTRVQTFGVIVKQSAAKKSYWLCKFDNGKGGYCHESILRFQSSSAPKHILGRDSNNDMVIKMKDISVEDEELIKTEIVLSKIYKLPGHNDYTYDALVKLHKKKYKWLNSWKLRSHVSKMRKHLMNTADPDYWLSKLIHDDTTDKIAPTTAKTLTMTTNNPSLDTTRVKVNNVAIAKSKSSETTGNYNRRLAKKFLSPQIRKHRKLNKHRYPYNTYGYLYSSSDECESTQSLFISEHIISLNKK